MMMMMMMMMIVDDYDLSRRRKVFGEIGRRRMSRLGLESERLSKIGRKKNEIRMRMGMPEIRVLVTVQSNLSHLSLFSKLLQIIF